MYKPKSFTDTKDHRHRVTMKKELIVEKLKDRGCHITKQRLMLLDIILEEECSSCKEIFYKATKLDKGIGPATVYRLINTLEEIGAIDRKNLYKLTCGKNCNMENSCLIEFEDDTVLELSTKNWMQVIQVGLKECGYDKTKSIRNVTITTCDCGL